jgi:hypothetical protein
MTWAEIDQEPEMPKLKKAADAEVEAEAGSDAKTAWTMSIPAAGRKYFNLGKWASYQTAYEVGASDQKEGLIPYVRIGRLKKALPRQIEKKLAGGSD